MNGEWKFKMFAAEADILAHDKVVEEINQKTLHPRDWFCTLRNNNYFVIFFDSQESTPTPPGYKYEHRFLKWAPDNSDVEVLKYLFAWDLIVVGSFDNVSRAVSYFRLIGPEDHKPSYDANWEFELIKGGDFVAIENILNGIGRSSKTSDKPGSGLGNIRCRTSPNKHEGQSPWRVWYSISDKLGGDESWNILTIKDSDDESTIRSFCDLLNDSDREIVPFGFDNTKDDGSFVYATVNP